MSKVVALVDCGYRSRILDVPTIIVYVVVLGSIKVLSCTARTGEKTIECNVPLMTISSTVTDIIFPLMPIKIKSFGCLNLSQIHRWFILVARKPLVGYTINTAMSWSITGMRKSNWCNPPSIVEATRHILHCHITNKL